MIISDHYMWHLISELVQDKEGETLLLRLLIFQMNIKRELFSFFYFLRDVSKAFWIVNC